MVHSLKQQMRQMQTKGGTQAPKAAQASGRVQPGRLLDRIPQRIQAAGSWGKFLCVPGCSVTGSRSNPALVRRSDTS